MKRYVKQLVKKILDLIFTCAILSCITSLIVEDHIVKNIQILIKELSLGTQREVNVKRFNEIEAIQLKKDWEDYAGIEAESKRVGLGEQGVAAHIPDESQKELEATMFSKKGFNALLSDMVSLNRSVPDVRKRECRGKQYLAKLPSVSIVIPFYNEHLSVLLRTLHSIVNRTPAELLHQIIIVDDGSDHDELKTQLNDYIQTNFPRVITILRQSANAGLIVARLAGARLATADVLVFFDSHIECTHNWLPPLLEPIALNRKVATCPIIDTIDYTTFAHKSAPECRRGIFNWNMIYEQLNPSVSLRKGVNTSLCHSPVMMGGLFAIRRDFFWELGGYDEGLEVWGGEQYELSFKIWMCGGMVLDVPCSHVSHLFRKTERPNPKKYDYVARNHKRVAEVWMDEYKQYVYASNPEAYNAIDPGDLTAQHENRKRLKCKSFKWFLEEVAPDMFKLFPPVPINYASGAVQSIAYPLYCLDNYGKFGVDPVKLFKCAQNKTHPHFTQYWTLTHLRELRNKQNGRCLDVYGSKANETIWMFGCHSLEGNQLWYYDRQHQWLVHGRHSTSCMEAMVDGDKLEVYVNPCNSSNLRMKWQFGTVNHTALDAFYEGLDV